MSRVWCLFEILHTLALPNPKLRLALTPNKETELSNWLNEANELHEILGTVESVKAKATMARDWVHIMTMIALEDSNVPREALQAQWEAKRGAPGELIELEVSGKKVAFYDYKDEDGAGVWVSPMTGHAKLDSLVLPALSAVLLVMAAGMSFPLSFLLN